MLVRSSTPLVLATRRSPLALRQAELARTHLLSAMAGLWVAVNLLEITTTGDKQRDWSLPEYGGKGLFTRELEEALLDGRARLAVHSAKDLPTTLPEGLALAGFLPRADARDVLVRRAELKTPQSVATGSPRRRAQAEAWMPGVDWRELRGNVETRLKKIAAGEADATFLAAAGLARLGLKGWDGLEFEPMPVERMTPAAGQGAVALECRVEDVPAFAPYLCADTARAVTIERVVLAALGGGCQTASGAHVAGNTLHVFHAPCGRIVLPLTPGDTTKAAADAAEAVVAWINA